MLSWETTRDTEDALQHFIDRGLATRISVNGQLINDGTSVTESNPTLGYFDINPAPFVSDTIAIAYQVGTLTPPTASAGIVSGSDQVSGSFEIIGTGIVSGSSQLDGTTISKRLESLKVHLRGIIISEYCSRNMT